MKKLVGFVSAVAFAFSLSLGAAHARPNYMKAFTTAYPNVTAAATAKCATCHGAEKKIRNDYGKAVGTALGKAKASDDEINAALKKVEETHKEYAEKLKAGKLPVE